MKQFKLTSTAQQQPKMVSADDWRQGSDGFLTFYAGQDAVFAIRHDYVVSIETVIAPVLVPDGADMRPGALNPAAQALRGVVAPSLPVTAGVLPLR